MANRPNEGQSEDGRDMMEDDDVRGLAREEGESADDADDEFDDEEVSDENEDEE